MFLRDDLLPAARDAYRSVSASYALGGSSALEVIDAQRRGTVPAHGRVAPAIMFSSMAQACLPVLTVFALTLSAGDFPRKLDAYRGATPVLDGQISPGEWNDATQFSGVADWIPQFTQTTNPKDLSLRGYVKHDGRRLYFAFDVTDDVLYGIDTPRRSELIAATHTLEEIRDFLEADTLGYLSLEGLLNSVGSGRQNYCSSCYTGVYPVEFPRDERTYLQLALKLDKEPVTS